MRIASLRRALVRNSSNMVATESRNASASRGLALAALVLAAAACSGCGSSAGSGSESEATDTGGDTTAGTDTTGDDTSGESGDFINDADMGASPGCDPLGSDCPEGQKCSPYGAVEWEDFRCVDLHADPKGPGSACMIDGGLFSGIDDCDATSVCVPGDPVGTGLCQPYCDHLVDDCGGEARCLLLFDLVPSCFSYCDPVAQDCGEGAHCSNIGLCYPGAGLGGAYGEPCTQFPCGPGLHCRPADEISECADTWCCTQLCWADEPNGADACPEPTQTCEPIDPDGLGYCALP